MSDSQFWQKRVNEGAVLSPIDRISEILFGLIMVLTFTGAISVATGGRQEIRQLLWSALGCNLAWGIVDAIMYLMNQVLVRARAVRILKELNAAKDADAARDILKEELPSFLTALWSESELDAFGSKLKQLPPPSRQIWLTGKDFFAGIEILLLVFLCTLPVALPFAFVKDPMVALRASNGVALLLLFAGGFRLAQYSGLRPVVTAVAYVLIGVCLVSLTMALGG